MKINPDRRDLLRIAGAGIIGLTAGCASDSHIKLEEEGNNNSFKVYDNHYLNELDDYSIPKEYDILETGFKIRDYGGEENFFEKTLTYENEETGEYIEYFVDEDVSIMLEGEMFNITNVGENYVELSPERSK